VRFWEDELCRFSRISMSYNSIMNKNGAKHNAFQQAVIAAAHAANAARNSAEGAGKVFRIGVDFGGVLSEHDAAIGAEHVNTAIDMPFALENLIRLKQMGHKLYLISFCGKARAIQTKESLMTSMIGPGMSCADLFEKMYFVKDRSKKREMCEYLKCHFMVDDRTDIQEEVAKSLCHTIPILFGESSHSTFIAAPDWNVVSNIIGSTPYFTASCSTEFPKKYVFDI
jgi:hypothetical protein